LVPEKVCASFEDFTGRVGSLFGVDLTLPLIRDSDVPSFKKFCGGLLEPSGSHPWAGELKRKLPAVDRLSVAGSLFSFRKILPSSSPDLSAYAERMSEAPEPAGYRYKKFISKEIDRMFRPGWDRRWRDFVLSTSPSGSACLTVNKSCGGARSEALWKRDWFIGTCMGINDCTIPSVRKLGIVVDSGKSRIVSSSPWESIILSPLHKMIYSHISRFDWLLRGEADPGSFQPFVRKQGEVFVSGDYESATDNLKLDVAIHILRRILSRARFVPKSVRREAINSLSCLLDAEGKLYKQRRGQLMGNYLSFPLLCLQNYLAFRFYAGFSYPVRINGDDIVFRAPQPVYDRWSRGVSSTGLTLSKGKTFVHPRFFSLNSKYFRARSVKKPVIVPILRATCLYRKCEDPNQIAGWANRIGEGFSGPQAFRLQIAVLQRCRTVIRCTQRSLTRGLGVKVNPAGITIAGFRQWEMFYLAQARESPPPRKEHFGSIPQGWAKVPCPLGGKDDPGFGAACVRAAWRVPARRVSVESYWTEVRRHTVVYRPRRKEWFRKAAKLAGLSVGQCRAWLEARLEIPRVVKRVWCQTGD
jgi:hypothetical protein